jgi:hypothetical protein
VVHLKRKKLGLFRKKNLARACSLIATRPTLPGGTIRTQGDGSTILGDSNFMADQQRSR